MREVPGHSHRNIFGSCQSQVISGNGSQSIITRLPGEPGYEIELRADQNPEPPAYFTRVEIKHKLSGHIDPEAVKAAIHLSETKYCAVGAMIAKTAKLETTFEILPEESPENLTEAA